jgi:hypothetical protein
MKSLFLHSKFVFWLGANLSFTSEYQRWRKKNIFFEYHFFAFLRKKQNEIFSLKRGECIRDDMNGKKWQRRPLGGEK